ncbi:hypothetical protein Droror1_Dr00008869 [Drosera rotundifolia]
MYIYEVSLQGKYQNTLTFNKALKLPRNKPLLQPLSIETSQRLHELNTRNFASPASVLRTQRLDNFNHNRRTPNNTKQAFELQTLDHSPLRSLYFTQFLFDFSISQHSLLLGNRTRCAGWRTHSGFLDGGKREIQPPILLSTDASRVFSERRSDKQDRNGNSEKETCVRVICGGGE